MSRKKERTCDWEHLRGRTELLGGSANAGSGPGARGLDGTSCAWSRGCRTGGGGEVRDGRGEGSRLDRKGREPEVPKETVMRQQSCGSLADCVVGG